MGQTPRKGEAWRGSLEFHGRIMEAQAVQKEREKVVSVMVSGRERDKMVQETERAQRSQERPA